MKTNCLNLAFVYFLALNGKESRLFFIPSNCAIATNEFSSFFPPQGVFEAKAASDAPGNQMLKVKRKFLIQFHTQHLIFVLFKMNSMS